MNGAVCQAVHSEYNGAVTVCQVGMSKLAPVQRAFNTEAAQSGYYDWPCNSTQEAAHGPTCLLKSHPENQEMLQTSLGTKGGKVNSSIVVTVVKSLVYIIIFFQYALPIDWLLFDGLQLNLLNLKYFLTHTKS